MGLKLLIGTGVLTAIVIGVLVTLVGYWPAPDDAAIASSAAAVWTQIYAIGSLLQLLGLGAAALFAYRAWKESEKQVAAAEKSAEAAVKAVSVTQSIGEKQGRCYLDFESVELGFGDIPCDGYVPLDDAPSNAPETHSPVATITLRNYGASPALDVAFSFSIRYDTLMLEPDGAFSTDRQSSRNFPFQETEENRWGQTISPGSTYKTSLRCRLPANDVEWKHLNSDQKFGGVTVILVIALRFRDVYGKTYFEEHCYMRYYNATTGIHSRTMIRMPILFFESNEEQIRRGQGHRSAVLVR